MSSPALPLPPTPSVTTPKIVEVLKPEVKTLERVLVDFVSAGAATLAIAPGMTQFLFLSCALWVVVADSNCV